MATYTRDDVIQIQEEAYKRGRSESQARILQLENAVKFALAWLDKFGEHAPIEFGGEQELHDILHGTLAAEHSVHPTRAGVGDL